MAAMIPMSACSPLSSEPVAHENEIAAICETATAISHHSWVDDHN